MIEKAATKYKVVVYGYIYLSLLNRMDHLCINILGKEPLWKENPAGNQDTKECAALGAEMVFFGYVCLFVWFDF